MATIYMKADLHPASASSGGTYTRIRSSRSRGIAVYVGRPCRTKIRKCQICEMPDIFARLRGGYPHLVFTRCTGLGSPQFCSRSESPFSALGQTSGRVDDFVATKMGRSLRARRCVVGGIHGDASPFTRSYMRARRCSHSDRTDDLRNLPSVGILLQEGSASSAAEWDVLDCRRGVGFDAPTQTQRMTLLGAEDHDRMFGWV